MYRTIETAIWTDEGGRQWKAPTSKRRMDYARFPLHAAVRAFVHRRDEFKCRACGRKCSCPSTPYDGVEAVICDDDTLLVVDHILSLRRGGTNHPSNLQLLCDPCNARKVTTHDAPGRAW